MGTYTGYATDQEEFLTQLENGDYYDYDVDDRQYVEYDEGDIEWEIDEGYIDDYISDRIYDQDWEDIVHNVNLVNN